MTSTRIPVTRAVLGFLVFLWLGASHAGALGRAIRFEHLSPEDGLSQSTVMCLLQDSRGFLWLGTEAGLNRYDGRTVTVYRHDVHDVSSIPSDFVNGLAEDSSGDLWVATDGGGLARWERAKDRFVRYASGPRKPEGPGSAQLRTVLVDRKGGIWVGTKDSGLAHLDPKSGRWQRFAHVPADSSSLADDGVYGLYEDGAGRLWVSTNGGLALFDAAAGSFHNFRHDPKRPESLADDRVRGVREDREGRLWIATFGGGLDVLAKGSDRFEHRRHDPANPRSLADDVVHAVLEDSAGRLWVGTRGGLQLREPDGSFTRYRHDGSNPHSLADDDVLSLYEDRAGVMWFGTRAGGAARFNPRTWDFGHVPANPSDPDGLANGYVTSFAEDRSGNVWIGTMGGGLHELDRTTGRMRRYKKGDQGLSDDRVMTLLHDRRGRLWVGTMQGGLARLDTADGRFEVFRNDPARPGSLSANGVIALLEDRAGALWVGTFGGGLDRLDPNAARFTAFRHDPADPTSLSRDVVTALCEDAGGAIWVGTEGGGLNRFDPRERRFQRFRHDAGNPETIGDDTVYSLHVDSGGTLWAGTRSGLSQLEAFDSASGRARFRTWTNGDGLVGNVVYGIETDGLGRLWLSGSQGLLRFDPRTATFKQFTASHGLQGNEFNFGSHFRSKRGELFFGGPEGFNAFLPDRLQTNSTPPPVVLTGFSKFNRPVNDGGPAYGLKGLRLDYRDSVVSFDFAALDYAAPERNRYSYRLEGFHDQWIDLGTERRITFTNLDAGRYVLRVMAANNDGVWNERGLALPIDVVPPPWKSAWAFLLYGVLAVGLAAGLAATQHRRLKRETEYRKRLEIEVQQRTEELGRQNNTLEQLNGQLVESSLTDALTGIRNRRYLFEVIDKEMSLVQRECKEMDGARGEHPSLLVFMMIDLDWFKAINDTCGHAAGDRVLVQMTQLIEKACRKSDVLIRWGGDEFLVVGRTRDLAGVEAVPERIRTTLESTAFDLGDGQVAHLTCSIGFTCYPGTNSQLLNASLEQVVALADRALYAAKRAGRNTWVGLLGRDTTATEGAASWGEAEPEELIESGQFDVLRSTDHAATPSVS
jgi:diguanylate cyclase (GGDEF)-like protein